MPDETIKWDNTHKMLGNSAWLNKCRLKNKL